MIKSFRHLGVSFCRNRIQLASITHGKVPALGALSECETSLDLSQAGIHLSGNHPQIQTLVKDLSTLIERNKIRGDAISFGLPREPVFVGILPVESSLQGPTLKEHMRWELGQYYPGVASQEFVIDAVPLPDKARSFIVGVRRGIIEFLQSVAKQLKLPIRFVDIDHFSAEKTLRLNYPEAREGSVVLVGVRYGGIDASLIVNGELTDYLFVSGEFPQSVPTAAAKYLAHLRDLDAAAPGKMFLCGLVLPPDVVKRTQAETGIAVEVCNPFRKLSIAGQIYQSYLKEGSRFAAAIGLALRSE